MRSQRPVLTVDLRGLRPPSWRPNIRIKSPVDIGVMEIIGSGILGLIGVVLAILIFS